MRQASYCTMEVFYTSDLARKFNPKFDIASARLFFFNKILNFQLLFVSFVSSILYKSCFEKASSFKTIRFPVFLTSHNLRTETDRHCPHFPRVFVKELFIPLLADYFPLSHKIPCCPELCFIVSHSILNSNLRHKHSYQYSTQLNLSA